MKLQGKTAIITGGAAGFGRATALKFAKEGANLMLADLNEEGLKETKAMILGNSPEIKVSLYKADVSSEEDVKGFVEATTAEFGALDIIFNNAGIEGFATPLADMPFDLFKKTLAINLHSVFLGMKYAIAYMKDHGGGAIVNTSSIGGLVALPGSSDYVATKHAVIGLTKNAAAEYGPDGIRTNAICPGFVMTDLHKRVLKGLSCDDAEVAKEMIKSNEMGTPLRRYGEVDEVADLVLFLASSDSSYINGLAVAIDGGFIVTPQ
jgi:NAD(P)-dependent dehydrogenase (short-subunit alcohol dehydrogenase family)